MKMRKRFLSISLVFVLLMLCACFAGCRATSKINDEQQALQNNVQGALGTQVLQGANNTLETPTQTLEGEKNNLYSDFTTTSFGCDSCKLQYWGNKENGGFVMFAHCSQQQVVCVWSPEGEILTSCCAICKQAMHQCVCPSSSVSTSKGYSTTTGKSVGMSTSNSYSEGVGHSFADSNGVATSNSFSTSSSLAKCSECGFEACICAPQCQTNGCDGEFMSCCGAEKTHHKCGISYGYGHKPYCPNYSSFHTDSSAGMGVSKPTTSGSNSSGDSLLSEIIGTSSTGVNTSHGISDNADLVKQVGYEKTEDGFIVFCCQKWKAHQIELE